jgi:hypothetical protein
MLCHNCKKEFPMYVDVDGKRRCLSRRRYCLECSPLGFKNTVRLEDHPNYVVQALDTRKVLAKKKDTERSVKRNREKRILLTLKAIEYKGGKCIRCGYNKFISALEFHHVDPSTKSFVIAKYIHAKPWDEIQKELDKCDLLCANCHREEHAILRTTL